jgi:hypothetical protein
MVKADIAANPGVGRVPRVAVEVLLARERVVLATVVAAVVVVLNDRGERER